MGARSRKRCWLARAACGRWFYGFEHVDPRLGLKNTMHKIPVQQLIENDLNNMTMDIEKC